MKLLPPFLSAALATWLALVPTVALRAQEPVAPVTQDKGAAAPAVSDPAATPAQLPAPAAIAPASPSAPAAPVAPPPPAEIDWIDRGKVTVFGDNVTIREDERASEVVAFGGNVTVLGRVEGRVVAWGGNVRVEGSVGSVTAAGGNLSLGPKAQVDGTVAVIGGHVANPHRVPLRSNPLEMMRRLPSVPNLLGWFGDSVTNVRLLSPRIAWPWYAFGACLLFYLLLAAAFGRGINACARSLEERPGSTLATALALLPLLPLFVVLLVCTIVGVLLLPFLAVALLFAFAFGKAAVLAFLGRSLLRAFGAAEAAERAWLTVPIGAVLLAVLYCVPVLGLLIWALTAWVGLGMVVATILENRRREKAAAKVAAAATMPAPAMRAPAAGPAVAPTSAVPAAPVVATMPANVSSAPVLCASVAPAEGVGPSPVSSTPAGAAIPPVMPPPPPPAPAVPPVFVEATGPRAEFGVRLGALLIDIVLVAVGGGVSLVFSLLPFPLLFGAYAFAFWLWRGTTVGGIVFNLKVVRLDGRPVDAATAAVRTLVAFLSAVTLLGFLWCLWDDERQTWHDKVAGTVVVRVPKATPLV
jgi:uncharacterized RDD family membrane protein YckC